MKKQIEWSKVDWSKYDAAIAKDIGISREAVRRMRKRKGVKPVKKIAKPLPVSKKKKSEQLAKTILAWERLGVEEYLPKFAQKAWGNMTLLAREILTSPNFS